MKPSISSWERRDYLKSMNRASRVHLIIRTGAILILSGLLAAWAMKQLYPLLASGPARSPLVMVDGKEGDLTTLCAQYRNDKLASGMRMEGETAELCGY